MTTSLIWSGKLRPQILRKGIGWRIPYINASQHTLLHLSPYHLGHLPMWQYCDSLGFMPWHSVSGWWLPSSSIQVISLCWWPLPQLTEHCKKKKKKISKIRHWIFWQCVGYKIVILDYAFGLLYTFFVHVM